MQFRFPKRSMSLRSLSFFFTAFFVIATLSLAVFSFWQISQNQKAADEADRSFLSHQMELVADSAGYINAYMFDTLTNNEYVKIAQTAEDTLSHNNAYRQIQKTMDYENNAFHSDFSYMFYVTGDSSIISRSSGANYFEDEQVRDTLIKRIDSSDFLQLKQRWRCDVFNDDYYLFQVFRSDNAYICAWTKCSSAFDFFLNNSAYQDASISYGAPDAATDFSNAGKKTVVSFAPEMIDTQIDFIYTSSVNYEAIGSIVLMFSLAFLIYIGFYLYVMAFYNQNVVQPLQALMEGIATIESLPQSRYSGISELNDVNSALSTLKTQLENIKVQYYESQLDLVRTELDYFMLQIKPHFFINCLNIIHSMIQKQSYDRAQQFCVHLSRYIRYLFSDSLHCVPLKDELAHLNLYLKIQNIRHHSTLFIDENLSQNTQEALVPPLLLVTFVENSIKYSTKSPDELVVELSVNRITQADKEYLSILISDNGIGFPDSYIQQFNAGNVAPFASSDGMHNVGIQNICKRMSLLYEENFSLQIMNNHGASVLIQLPYQLTQPDISGHDR